MPVLAITPGEPAGIGPEILLKYQQAHPESRILAVADPGLLSRTAQSLGIEADLFSWRPGDDVLPGKINCLATDLAEREQPGQLNPANASYVLDTLRAAVSLVRAGHATALVTGPVHKGVINDAGHPFSGHTEFLAKLAGVPQVVMMLATPGLRVCLVTTHLPLRAVADAITPAKLETVISITEASLREQFGIDNPRLQILGLNPHAGEGGHLGHEEDEIIRPVIERLRAQGMDLRGPVPADTAFNPPHLEQCDAVVAMYHDQGLPVLKHMGFGNSVNITLGLPFIRTSVDHGTALDLAGSGKADTGSLEAAVVAAEKMAVQKLSRSRYRD
ncbi:4-hydroxythreonine-4-phosphate dehydrogenase PdxA [Pseudomonadota bacterium]